MISLFKYLVEEGVVRQLVEGKQREKRERGKRQTDRQTGRQADRQADRNMHTHTCIRRHSGERGRKERVHVRAHGKEGGREGGGRREY